MSSVHEINFHLYGDDMQFVEIKLDGGESVIAEAGAMIYMDNIINMDTIIGDGSGKNKGKGFISKFMNAGKRFVIGEGLFMTLFSNIGNDKAHIAFAAPYPGKVVPFDLTEYGRTIICQKDAFLCATKGVSIDIHFQKKIGAGFFGGEGFIMQKLKGDGMAFLHAGGTIIRKDLQVGEMLKIDTGCLVAMSSTVKYDVQFAGGIKSGIFGGEGLFFATLKGAGTVWLQSQPFSRMADRVYSAASGSKGEKKDLDNSLEELSGLAKLFEKD